MSQTELSWCSPFHIHTLFMHKCCWMTHSQGLKDFRHIVEAGEGCRCAFYVAAESDPVSPWRDGSMQTFPCPDLWLMLVLWATPCWNTWGCWVRCFQDLSRTWWDEGPGGSLSRDNSPSVAEGGCLWPAWFWGQRLPPHGFGHTNSGLSFWVYPGFWQGCLEPLIQKAKEGKKIFLTPFFLYFFL